MRQHLPENYQVDADASATVEGFVQQLSLDDPDHAQEKNKIGFSAADQLGHALAEQAWFGVPFSFGQALDALQLVTKYRRQLFGGDTDEYRAFNEAPVFTLQPMDVPPRFNARRRNVWVQDGQLRLKHPFGDDMYQSIPTTFTGAIWMREKPKSWQITVNSINTPEKIRKFLNDNQFIVLNDVIEFLETVDVVIGEEKDNKGGRIMSSTTEGLVQITFPYDKDLVASIKSSLKHTHKGQKSWAKWDAANKVWTIAPNETVAISIQRLVDEFDFEVDERISTYLAKVTAKKIPHVVVDSDKIAIDTTKLSAEAIEALNALA